tara:strand:- start:1129 stop:1950 length:822 start_codon:yes stop_codon:yes gene_type:complete
MSKQQEATKDVAPKKEAGVPVKIDLEALSGQGTENITARDTRLPLLKILYANSPVLDEDDGKYNEKAKQGDIYNEITGSLYKSKEGLLAVPCHYNNTFNEWQDRGESLGRPVAIHTDPTIMTQTTKADDGKDRLPNGNYVEDTGNHFIQILNSDYEPIEMALIPMKSTQKKKSKLWNSMIISRKVKGKNGLFVPPSWSQVYRLKSTKESNSQNSWYGWVIEFDSILDPSKQLDALQVSKSFYESCKKQDIFNKVAFEEEGEPKKVKGQDNTPF